VRDDAEVADVRLICHGIRSCVACSLEKAA
jgi:hypothetical protein